MEIEHSVYENLIFYHCVLIFLTDFNTINLIIQSSQKPLVQFTKGKGIQVQLKEESFSFQTEIITKVQRYIEKIDNIHSL